MICCSTRLEIGLLIDFDGMSIQGVRLRLCMRGLDSGIIAVLVVLSLFALFLAACGTSNACTEYACFGFSRQSHTSITERVRSELSY